MVCLTHKISDRLSAGEAHRHFSSLLREVATGEVFTVLLRGMPVATIAPCARARQATRGSQAQLIGTIASAKTQRHPKLDAP
jgi:antitoxin (DNA-binding transcriptional repressor) of toxin-antitoxin stability system